MTVVSLSDTMALLQDLLHLTNVDSPLLRGWLPPFGITWAIQTAFAVPSILGQSDLFYDFSALLSFLSAIPLSVYLPYLRVEYAGSWTSASQLLGAPFVGDGAGNPGMNWRQLVLSGAASIWGLRLGYHLFTRALRNGGDSRLEEMKKSPRTYLYCWIGQATWITLTVLPVVAVNSIPAAAFDALPPTTTLTDYLGFALYLLGLSFEVIADNQKARWTAEKKNKIHDEQFLTRGLWGRSRFPHYFGEVTLWTGVTTVAAGVLVKQPVCAALGWSGGLFTHAFAVGLPYASPAFVAFLLLKVSGVAVSERKYDEKYGDREDYQQWKRNTPKFFPKIVGWFSQCCRALTL
ncbi:hypothetical protein FE257_000945 [Aspergillus nanangensis]|uniref:Steroid 5-alpha reductase C-terminal domain-containing protein n=1 Tax=Aspergillus nanangensis TaxID=2582783 RepID=A0AAD4GQZ4_ASPNN|nr:hypothetical protein FE257_000945 [Aspergillus nanangensis]